jgi:hypothetical protein
MVHTTRKCVDYSKDGQTSIAESGSKGLHTAVSLLLIERPAKDWL